MNIDEIEKTNQPKGSSDCNHIDDIWDEFWYAVNTTGGP